MNSSGSASDGTRDAIRHLISEFGEPSTPLTTDEVSEKLECDERTAEQNLSTLVDLGELQTRTIDTGAQVWWQPADQAKSADRASQLQEFGAFVSSVKDYAIFMLDPDGTVISWNQGARRIKGYSEEDIIGEHFSTFYTEEDTKNGVPERNLRVAEVEGRVEDEGWRIRKDGTRFWANVIITSIWDVDGTLQGFTKVTRDMTEQREYELQLRKERDLIEQILETVPVGICVIDSDREFVRANQQAAKILGIEDATTETLSIESIDLYDGADDLIPTDDGLWARVIDTGESIYNYQCQIERANGDRRWISVNAAPLEGDLAANNEVVISLEDVTDQKNHERQLEQRKAELETEMSEIMGRISDAFFALDDEWRFTHLNDYATALFGHTADELEGRSFWDVFPERTEGPLWERFHSAMAAQEPANFDLYDDPIGEWLEFKVYPSETGMSIYFHEITERIEYQQKLEESNERLEQFAYAASHDLQEPLRMISSYLQLIAQRYEDELGEDGLEYLDFAVDGADRMRDMIEGLLAYSRVDSGGKPFEPVDLDTLLTEVRNDLQLKIAESNAEITAESLPRVEGDANQLHQLFQNLLDNAITYSGDEPPQVHVGAEHDGARWKISISDEGIGIDAENADRVFEVFQRLHTNDEHDGTGIGLALCERIVERHGGSITLDSEPGEGSTFSFTLPATRD